MNFLYINKMEEDKTDSQKKVDKIIRIITNLYNWEKEKEKMFFNNEKNKNLILEQNKTFFLIDKNWINLFKKNIKYDKLIEKIENDTKTNSEINDEEIIKKTFLEMNDYEINKLTIDLQSYNSNLEEDKILNNLLENQKFDLEIINEEIKNSLFFYNGIKLKINGLIIEDYILFEMQINEKNIILLVFPLEEKEEDCIYKIFFIFDYDTKII